MARQVVPLGPQPDASTNALPRDGHAPNGKGKPLAPSLGRALTFLALLNEILVVAATALNLGITFVNTVIRYVFNSGLTWAGDMSSILIAIGTFLGAAAFLRRSSGMAYTALVDSAKGTLRDAMVSYSLWTVTAVCGISLWVFPPFFASQLRQTLPVLGVSNGIVGIWLGIGMALMIVFTLEKLAGVPWRGLLLGLAAMMLVGLLLYFLQLAYDSGSIETDPLLPVAALLLVSFLTGAPISIILALGGLLYFVMTDAAPMVAIPVAYQAGIGSFVLVAVPFFMIAGALMEVTGMGGRLIGMVQEWVGHWSGGLLLAEVVAMYLFSGMSGSKAADIATVGSVMKRPLRECGYPPSESVAVLAAAAAMGEVVPPSLALLILGSITTLSIGSLFIAGIVPAALLAAALVAAIILRGRSRNWHKGPPFALGRALRSIPPTFPALLVPVIVVGGIVGGIASPTEASSFAVVYGVLVAILGYRGLTWRAGWPAIRDATLTAGMVLFMVATANLLSQAIVIDGLGRTLAGAFGHLENRETFLFLSMAALIVIGFVLEGFPAILISAPILLPVAEKLGVDPLQYGVLLIMAIGIGVFMPPIGIGYYVACAVGEAPPNATMRPSAMYNVFLILGLVIAVAFPQITLYLPHLFGMH